MKTSLKKALVPSGTENTRGKDGKREKRVLFVKKKKKREICHIDMVLMKLADAGSFS